MTTSMFCRPPPLDISSLTITGLYEFHAANSPDHPLFTYSLNDTQHNLTFSRVWKAIRLVAQNVALEVPETLKGKQPLTVGVLAVADSITSATVMLGLIQARVIPFLISPRNSVEAINHLLSIRRVSYIYCSSDQPTLDKAMTSIATLANPVKVLSLPTFEDLYRSDTGLLRLPVTPEPDLHSTCLILHSSGTTTYPKPIPITHSGVLAHARVQYNGAYGKPGHIDAIHWAPMFHLLGISHLARALTTPVTLATFPPMSPPQVPFPDKVIEAVVKDKCTTMLAVPSLVEQWANDPGSVRVLAQLKVLIIAGGPLSEAVGEALIAAGVQLTVAYGATEIGTISSAVSPTAGTKDWIYFPLSSLADVKLIQQEDTGLFEVYLLETPHPRQTPAVYNTKISGINALNLHDLLRRHPDNPDLWRIVGRSDDQIILSNGEKTNPGPLEAMLLKDPRIQHAIMFGRERPHNGVILQLTPQAQFDHKDESRLEAFRLSLEPLLKALNEFAPTHSHLYKEMIIIADAGRPFPITLKGAPRRSDVLASYEVDIERAYQEFGQADTSAEQTLSSPLPWSEEVCESFVLSVLKSNLNIAHDLGLQDDIFHIGCDSLQAQHIVKRLSAAVAKSAKLTLTSAPPIPNSFPYYYPTPASMIRALCQLQSPEAAGSAMTPQSLLKSLLPEPRIASAASQELAAVSRPETVLITGTTGSLGSAMLSQLMSLPDIEKIFTLNRGDPDVLVERQSRTFETYGFVPIQNDQKVQHLVGDMNVPNWGIEQETFEQIRRNVTLIIHNAWPVNFNMVLNSFIPSITAVRSLAEFAATKASLRPRVLFISSIAASRVDQTQSTPSSSTTRFGYAESKWVAERVLEAFLPDPERLSILRIGQICGGANGVWNHKEWFPALIQASCAIGALPTFEDTRIAWIPLDSVASTIIDSAFRLWTKETRCLLVQHQSPITWETLNNFLLSELGKGISLVPFETWVERLEKSPSADLGASVLLDFFKAHQASYEAFIDGDSGRLESGVPPLGQEDVRRWVEHWKKIKFLSN